MKRLCWLLLVCAFCSCDPGFSVILSNNSNQDRSVKIIESGQERFNGVKAVRVASISDSVYAFSKVAQLIERDSATKAYTFILEKGESALLQAGIGFPDYYQKIILDNRDTIIIKKDSRVNIKHRFMSTYVTILSE